MKNFTVLSLMFGLFVTGIGYADTAETEPNNDLNDSGVIIITAMGNYTGHAQKNVDGYDYWKIHFPFSGSLTMSLTPENPLNGVLFSNSGDYGFGTFVGSFDPWESLTHSLDGNLYYFIVVTGGDSITGANYIMTLSRDASLPVALTSFSASYAAGAVVLNWITESEVDNLQFNLYRSDNKESGYQKIAVVAGRGNSSERKEYQWRDNSVEPNQTYWYRISDVSIKGEEVFHQTISISTAKAAEAAVALEYALCQSYPNPFSAQSGSTSNGNPATTVEYQLAEAGAVELGVYNLRGERIALLVNQPQAGGHHNAHWRGLNDSGQVVSSGVYLIRLRSGSFSGVVKVNLVR